MKLSRLFLHLKKKTSGPTPGYSLDRKLITKARGSKFPRFAQFKYITRFLTPKERRVVSTAAVLLVCTTLLWAAVGISKHIISSPKVGGEYVEAVIGQPKYINPLFATGNEPDLDLVSLIYSGLFRHSSDGVLLPELAVSYTVSSDGKTYDVKLRDNVYWTDGEPFTADDVITTFELIKNPEVGSPLFASFQPITVENVGENTVRFTLKEPFAPFLSILTIGILPAHVWADIAPTNIRLAKRNLEPIGTGAWKFQKLTKDDVGNIQSYTLTRNADYFGGAPYLKSLTFKYFNDPDSAMEAVRSQNVSAMSFVPRTPKNKLSSRTYNSFSIHLPQYTAIFFNQTNNAALKNDKVRLALAQSLDKKAILNEALAGEGQVIDGPILEGFVGFSSTSKKIAFTVDGANTLLDESGWARLQPEEYFKLRQEALLKTHEAELDTLRKSTSTPPEEVATEEARIRQEIDATVRREMDGNQSFYRRSKDGAFLNVIITTVDTPEYQIAADTIAKAWRGIGVRVEVETVNYRQILHGVLKERSYQALLYGELVGADPDPYPFWHSTQTQPPGLNLANYADRTVDVLLEDGQRATSTKARAENYAKFQDILTRDIPAIFLYSPNNTFLVDKEIKGITVGKVMYPADRLANSNKWYTKTTWKWQ